MELGDIRRDYALGGLRRADLDANPLVQFQTWFAHAKSALEKTFPDFNSATLATADKSGRPSSRIVLLKGLVKDGFIFYTNYDSRKGRELAENPRAALTFFWAQLERQVGINGRVEKVSRALSETYFHSRPRGSQLAAWTSHQSEVVADRAALEKHLSELEKKFPGEIPLPPNWGGLVLKPERIEFWQGRPNRLHDRFQYLLQPDGSWKIDRLAP